MSSGEAGLVRVAWTAGRSEPDRRAEMVTQWVSGEALEIEGEGPGRWLGVRGPDGYRCWVDGGALVRASEAEAEAWADRATAFSLGTQLAPAPGERAGPPPPRWVPWGGRVAPAGGGRVEVAGGATVMPVEPAALVHDRADRFPPTVEALVRTARRWLGVPYLWGGRTREGVDCSGLVQAVFAAHRVELSRDSADQEEALADRDGAEDPPPVAGEAGELLFFGPGAQTGSDTDADADAGPGAGPGGVDHVALRVGGSRVLHAAAGNGQVAEDDLAGSDPAARRLRGRLRSAARPLEVPGVGGPGAEAADGEASDRPAVS